MAEILPKRTAKPGTACLGCRRRKLKCSREPDGCNNCLKSDLPCVYPAPESTGVKRKRGPYKKDKPPRERHLEDLVKYLEPKPSESDVNAGHGSFHTRSTAGEKAGDTSSSSVLVGTGQNSSKGSRMDDAGERKAGNSEDLVKDALIALTRTSAADRESIAEVGAANSSAKRISGDAGGIGIHPPVARIFTYWGLYTSRVDPLTKVIHCPTFAEKFLSCIDNLRSLGPAAEALLFAVYYAAVSTCTAREARSRFGESREVLLQRYGRSIEAALADNYGMPVLESLQALVLYMISIRREDNITNVRALFSLSVRMAQMMELQNDPGESYSPFEAEMRRRLWWQICGLESRGAEEGGARSNSIMENRNVSLPKNLLDIDLHPSSNKVLQPRAACTDMTFVLLRFETMRMVHRLWAIRKKHTSDSDDTIVMDLKSEQRKSLAESRQLFETQYLQYLDESRAYDWLCISFARTMLIKGRLIIDHPFGQVPSKQMTAAERFDLLQASVEIIGLSYFIESNKGADPWIWYFRGWTQWHSLAIIVFELGRSTNKQFASHAWAVLDPLLSRWDRIYSMKRDEPAWDHVNALIERARQMRQQNLSLHEATQSDDTTMVLPESLPSGKVSQTEPSNNYGAMPTTQPNLQSAWSNEDAHVQFSQSMDWDSRQLYNQPTTNVPFHTGCAPVLDGLDGDFGSFDGFDSIDFSAFDAVFGDSSWEYSSSNADWSVDGLIT